MTMIKKYETHDKLVRDILNAKRDGAVIMFRDGMYHGSDIFDICEAYRRVGFKEGYKKGKRDGSWAGYNVGYWEGHREAELLYDDDYDDLCWD
jgi:hypothetical protein